MKKTKMIAPRLASGDPRVHWGGGLPDYIKDGIRAIAARENKSVSWVMEEVVIRYFNLRTPKYIERKTNGKK